MKFFFIAIILTAALFIPITALAGPGDPPVTTVTLVNPLGGTAEKPQGLTDMRVLLGNIIAGAMGFVGSIVLAVFVYGGFLWLTSAGNTEQVSKGTNTMLWAAIGLFLIFGAYAILSLVLEAIGAKGGSGPVSTPSAKVLSPEDIGEFSDGDCELNVITLESVCSTFTLPSVCVVPTEEGVALCEWDEEAGDCAGNVQEMSALCESHDTKEACEGGDVQGDCQWVEE